SDIVRRAPGTPGAEHLPAQALARLNAPAYIVFPRGADLIAANQGIRVGLSEVNKCPFTAAEFLRPGDDALQHRIEVEGGAQTLSDLGQRLCFPPPSLHLGFGLLLHGDIPRNSGGANDLATRGADRRNGERNRDDLAVLSEPGGLILCDGFTPSELRQNLW